MRRLLVVLAALGLSGCSSGARTPLVVYSPHGKEMLSEFERQYEALHPEVDVQWLDMGSQDAYDRIRTERQNPQADVWWGAPSTTFARAESDSLLEPYTPAWDSAEPDGFKSSRRCWYGTFVTPEVIMYNNRVLRREDVPDDWDGLLDPKWRNKIVIRYPLASGTMRTIFCALIERVAEREGSVDAGFRWLRRLDANTKAYATDPTQLYLKIAREEAELTVWDLPDVVLQVEKNGYPFGYVVPKSGTPLTTDCIAIVKGARHGEEARRFYEFVTSRSAVARQAKDFYRIPTRSDIPAKDLPAWIADLRITPMPINWKELALHENEWMKRWDDQVRGAGGNLLRDPGVTPGGEKMHAVTAYASSRTVR